MIASETFRPDWLAELRRRYPTLDPSIAEKMIFALALVERLTQQELPFVFKGGTCLVLLLGQLRRFSVDVDIVTTATPAAIEAALERVCERAPFLRFEYHAVRSTKDDIPRGHYSVFFQPAQSLNRPEPAVALDVLYEQHDYPHVLATPIQSDFLLAAGSPQLVSIPSLESILGDKLTAYAPNTTGIRYGQGKEQEIIKQLFDVGVLFDGVEQVAVVQAAYQAIVRKELGYRALTTTSPDEVLLDTIRTSLQLARLKLNRATPDDALAGRELATGISAFANFPLNTRFRTDEATTSAAKAAYLAARLLLADYSVLPRYPDNPALAITDQRLNYLNKLRSVPAALFYWQHTITLMSGNALFPASILY